MSRSWVAERIAGRGAEHVAARASRSPGCSRSPWSRSAATIRARRPSTRSRPRSRSSPPLPLPPVPGASTTLSVTGRGLFHGVVRQGDVVVYRFVNATDMFTGTFTATSAAPPELTVEGSDGTIVRRTAGQ
jgi:hypothetical protein